MHSSRMQRTLDLPGWLLFGVVLGACAGTDVRPIPAPVIDAGSKRVIEDADASEDGIRFFQSAPFLLVHSDGKGGLSSEVIYLPDLTKKMAVRPYAYLASNKTTLTFSNGTLSQQTTTVDETTIPKAVVSAIQTAATAALKAMFNDPNSRAANGAVFPNPYLLRIVLTDRGVELHGANNNNGQAIDASGKPAPPIQLTISAPAKEAKP